MDGHRGAEGNPACGLLGWDAERFVGEDAGQLRDVVDIRLGVVLRLRRPATDDGADGVEAVLMIISEITKEKRKYFGIMWNNVEQRGIMCFEWNYYLYSSRKIAIFAVDLIKEE